MKFRFCGELDAPDWILAEVSVLSKMSSVRVKLICKLVVATLLGNDMNYEKLKKLTTANRLNFSSGDIKAMLAALSFMISNSAKYDVDGTDVLPQELEQLGLPRDICRAICRSFIANKTQLVEHFQETSLSLPRFNKLDWRVDYVLSSSSVQAANTSSIIMRLETNRKGDPEPETAVFQVDPDKFKVLAAELKAIRQVFTQVN